MEDALDDLENPGVFGYGEELDDLPGTADERASSSAMKWLRAMRKIQRCHTHLQGHQG